jgi:hypothetical protein
MSELLHILLSIQKEGKYQMETVMIALNYLDRYFSLVRVMQRKTLLYSLTLAAMLIACKLAEEPLEPHVTHILKESQHINEICARFNVDTIKVCFC